MGCGASQAVSPEVDIDPIDVPDTEDGYPPPLPPSRAKKDVFVNENYQQLDENARKAPRSLNTSYSTLIEYLTRNAKSDIDKVRSIFVWMSAQSIYDVAYPGVKEASTPDGYMKLIKQEDGDYQHFFALLCRAAGLPCVVVRGVGKAATYEVGQQDVSHIRSSWNAVHVDGSWRLVHPRWALFSLAGFDTGAWVKVEERGKATRERTKASSGHLVHSMDEFWFLTDPEKFVYHCLADRPEWQLLQTPWTTNKFLNVPHFTARYHDRGFKLVSEHAAILKSEKGECNILFQHESDSSATVDYTLFFDEKNSKDQIPKELQLDKYVVKLDDQKTLKIRFPVVGIYKVTVTGTLHSTCELCDIRLDCDAVLKHVQPFPINPIIGFGFGRKAEGAGLSKPTQTKGVLVVKESEKVKFQFECKEKVEVQALLVHKDVQTSDLTPYVKQSQEAGKVTIEVTVPQHAQNPEYALQINTRQEGSRRDFENVVNYLLTHDKQELETNVKKENKETEEEETLRKEMVASTGKDDIDSLEQAVTSFTRAGLADQGDLTKAREKLVLLHEQELRRAVASRDLKDLETALERSQRSCVWSDLDKGLVQAAEKLRSRLARARLFRILKLTQTTVSEILRYSRPQPIVHDTMSVTYLLLGEKERQLQQWEYIQSLLRRQGKQSLIRRIKEFDLEHLKVPVMQRAEVNLRACPEEDVRLSSAGAGTFFVWSRNILREKKKGQLAGRN